MFSDINAAFWSKNQVFFWKYKEVWRLTAFLLPGGKLSLLKKECGSTRDDPVEVLESVSVNPFDFSIDYVCDRYGLNVTE